MPVVSRQRPVPVNRGAAQVVEESSSVIDRIRPIECPDRGIRMALYGKSGTGKTTLACDFPKPLLYIRPPDDDGRRSVYQIPGILDVDLRQPEEFRELTAHVRETGKFVTTVLDSVSTLQELALKKVLKKEELPAQMGWGVATQQQWGEVGAMVKDLLREMLALEGHVIIVAQERVFDSEGRSSDILDPHVGCAVSPSVAGWIGPSVEYLVQTFLRQGTKKVKKKVAGMNAVTEVDEECTEFCLRVGPHPVYNTKFRVPRHFRDKLPDVIVDPTYNKIAKLVAGSAA